MKKRQPSVIIRKKLGSSGQRKKKKSNLRGLPPAFKLNEKKWVTSKITVVFRKFSDVVKAVTRSVGLKLNKKH